MKTVLPLSKSFSKCSKMIEANATLLQRVHLRQPIQNFNICNPELAQKLTNQPCSKVENIVGLNTE